MDLQAIDIISGKPIRVRIEGERIVSVKFTNPALSTGLPILAPGLVDLQLNGFRSVDFNGDRFSETDAELLTGSLLMQGVTSFLPTIVTASPEQISMRIFRLRTAIEKNPHLAAMVAGIHLEGPFISTEDGPRGAHDKNFVCAPDIKRFERWQEEAKGMIRLITISPEWPEAVAFTRHCVEQGVKVAIGHTAATADQIRAVVDAGADLSTHLGNAAHALLPRHPNYLWDQLADDRLWASVIADGFHLPDSVLKVFLKVKAEKIFLVSDATSLAGMPPGTYQSVIGGEVELSREGRLSMKNSPQLLAGSASSLFDAMDHIHLKLGLEWKDVWSMASLRPLTWLTGTPAPWLNPGAFADLVLLRESGDRLTIEQVILRGEKIQRV